MFFEEKKFV